MNVHRGGAAARRGLAVQVAAAPPRCEGAWAAQLIDMEMTHVSAAQSQLRAAEAERLSLSRFIYREPGAEELLLSVVSQLLRMMAES